MEANIPPVIIPIWLTGFDQVMPEGRPFPYNYMPRLATRISITFGDPLPPDKTREVLGLAHGTRYRGIGTGRVRSVHKIPNAELDQKRSEITDIIRHAVIALGREVSGPTLSTER